MKSFRFVQAAILLLAVVGVALAQDAAKAHPVLEAMTAEIERAKQLRVVGSDPPYFIQHTLFDGDQWVGAASLGAIVNFDHPHFRTPEVEVRVGDYEFDQSNYVRSLTTTQAGGFPLHNEFPVMRHQLWLSTDVAYKLGLDRLAAKRAALENVTLSEKLPDFSKAEPVVEMEKDAPRSFDAEGWKQRLRTLSALFQSYPDIQRSSVTVRDGHNSLTLANSEGTRLRLFEPIRYLRASAETQAADGMRVRDSLTFLRRTSALPDDATATKAIKALAQSVKDLALAPVGEAYVGPVLFEGDASPQLFAQLVGNNLVLRRNPVSDPSRPVVLPDSDFVARKGSRILPDWMDIEDNPALETWEGQPLIGAYKADLEGVKPSPLRVVEKGILKEFLLTRQPVKDYRQSNGRARLPGLFGARQAAMSNLIVKASQTKARGQLRTQLVEMIKQQGKPWGMLVRKLDYPSIAPSGELRALMSAAGAGSAAFSPPIQVFRIYPDGREELVRGLVFRNLNSRALRDLLAAAEGSVVYSFLNSGVYTALASEAGARFVAETSVVAPSAVLLEEVELVQLRLPLPDRPAAPPPSLEEPR